MIFSVNTQMNGSLERVNPRYITPKKVKPGQSSPDYSPAYPVELSPITDVKSAALANSMQESFDKKMTLASKGKGKRKTRKSKKSKRRSTIRRS